jgi:hypothetical protein
MSIPFDVGAGGLWPLECGVRPIATAIGDLPA